MNNSPKVSILMPCFNGSQYIERSFESILAQSYPSVELIFVDDGSTDDSSVIASAYTERFNTKGYKLVIHRQKNGGFCAAVVSAFYKSSGEFIQLLDVDDYIFPDSCSLQVEYLVKHPECNVVRTNGYIVPSDNLDDTSNPIVKPTESKTSGNIFMELLTGTTNNWAGSYMIRADKIREFYSNKEFPISRYGQNLQFLLPLTLSNDAGFIDKPLFKYIRYTGSHSNQPSFEKQLDNLDGYWNIRRRMLSLLDITDTNILNKCEIAYHNRVIYISLQFRNMKYYSNSYKALKRLNGLSLELRTQDAIIKNQPSQYIYRIFLRIKSMLCP